MSASITAASAHLPGRSRAPLDPPKVRVYEWGVAIPTIAAVAYFCAARWGTVSGDALELLLWAALIIPVDLMPISYSEEIHQTVSTPLLIAAGMVLQFQETALVALLACWDPRELSGRVGLARSLFNRSQLALSAGVASLAFHAVGGDVDRWPSAWGYALLALVVYILINWVTVTTAARLATGRPFTRVTRDILLETPIEFGLSYGALGLLALLFVSARETIGPWGLVLCVIPVVLGRQMFLHRKKSAQATTEAASKNQVIVKISEQIEEERREERARIAGSLHDEVLPAIFKVHLMGEVLRQDLDSGRLLALEDDIPELRHAADELSRLVRTLVRDLRRSAIGVGGLASTLQLLVEDLSTSSTALIEAHLEEVGGTPSLQLLIYQVAREALLNAVQHSGAIRISVRLFRDGAEARLIVADDGLGFVPTEVDREKHFGLQLMAERVEQVEGVLRIEACPGEGTHVVARLPIESLS